MAFTFIPIDPDSAVCILCWTGNVFSGNEWLYLTPMFYPIEKLPEKLIFLVAHCNPMYAYVTQLRCLTLYNCIPDMHMVLYGCIDACLALILGVWVFLKTQDRFILYI